MSELQSGFPWVVASATGNNVGCDVGNGFVVGEATGESVSGAAVGDSIGRFEGRGVKMFVGDSVGAGASVRLHASHSVGRNVGCDPGGGVIHSIGSGVGRGIGRTIHCQVDVCTPVWWIVGHLANVGSQPLL